MPGGQPAFYKTPEDLQKAVDAYFYLCDTRQINKTVYKDGEECIEVVDSPEPYTITGLALALGFCDRQSIYDYEKRPEYSCIIKTAMLKVENGYEKSVMVAKNAAGPIFVLKNMGWKDKNEVEHSGTVSIAQQIKAAYDNNTDK